MPEKQSDLDHRIINDCTKDEYMHYTIYGRFKDLQLPCGFYAAPEWPFERKKKKKTIVNSWPRIILNSTGKKHWTYHKKAVYLGKAAPEI